MNWQLVAVLSTLKLRLCSVEALTGLESQVEERIALACQLLLVEVLSTLLLVVAGTVGLTIHAEVVCLYHHLRCVLRTLASQSIQ